MGGRDEDGKCYLDHRAMRDPTAGLFRVPYGQVTVHYPGRPGPLGSHVMDVHLDTTVEMILRTALLMAALAQNGLGSVSEFRDAARNGDYCLHFEKDDSEDNDIPGEWTVNDIMITFSTTGKPWTLWMARRRHDSAE